MKTQINLDAFVKGYIACALWSSTEDGEPLDRNFDADDLSEEALEKMRADCRQFADETAAMIEGQEGQAGHDFWLTRNGHGAGFWDGDWPEHGEALSKASKSFGTCTLYSGDDGQLYVTSG